MSRVKQLLKALNESELTFAEIVKDSYRACCEKIAGWPQNYPGQHLPLAADVADDIINNYEGYGDIDVSNPEKYNAWCSEVAQELNRQNLEFQDEIEEEEVNEELKLPRHVQKIVHYYIDTDGTEEGIKEVTEAEYEIYKDKGVPELPAPEEGETLFQDVLTEASISDGEKADILTYCKGWDPEAKWTEKDQIKIEVLPGVAVEDIIDGAEGQINDYLKLYLDNEFEKDGVHIIYLKVGTKD